MAQSSFLKFFAHPAFAAIICFGLIWSFARSEATKVHKAYLNPPPEHVEYFHFGFKESLADSFWLRWIQDLDTCQTYLAPAVELDEAAAKVNPKDMTDIPRYRICDNSWSFKMLDAVTRLSPQFEMPYLAGASTLAILVEDIAGASVIYERGLEAYPNNWQLLYRASFHYQFNVKDIVKAAELLNRSADLGAPPWTRSLASRLYTQSGQAMLGLSVLESYRKAIDPDKTDALKQIDKRIADLKAQLASEQ